MTNIGNEGKVLVFEPATPVFADITKLTLVTEFKNIEKIGEATLILDNAGKLIGLAGTKSVPSYGYVAQYGYYLTRPLTACPPRTS